MQHTPSSTRPEGTPTRKLAFTEAYKAHVVFFLKYFKRKTGSIEDAEDLSVQFWESVYLKFAPHQFGHIRLLQRKAEQIFLAHLRKQSIRSFLTPTREVPDLIDTRPDRWDGTDEDEKRIQANFWERFPGVDLTEAEKNVFWLKAWHGYTLSELAERFRVPDSTIQDWIAKVREACVAAAEKEQS